YPPPTLTALAAESRLAWAEGFGTAATQSYGMAPVRISICIQRVCSVYRKALGLMENTKSAQRELTTGWITRFCGMGTTRALTSIQSVRVILSRSRSETGFKSAR